MSPVFKKLNLKDQTEIVVVNAPESFEPELATLEGVTILRQPDQAEKIVFSLAFVIKQAELDSLAAAISAKTQGDAVVWFAYPKASSKKYQCEFNRDTGWGELGRQGFEPVRAVAIDEDWSALRFRRHEYIKKMTRDASWAMSEGGKAKAGKAETKGQV